MACTHLSNNDVDVYEPDGRRSAVSAASADERG